MIVLVDVLERDNEEALMNSSMYRNLTITALLMALAIMIPIVMPLKVVIPPASYTLVSHVPIFLSMFLSRKMAACVVEGSTLGFFVAGFPIVIVMRAASHMIFALMGAYYIKQHPSVLTGGPIFYCFQYRLRHYSRYWRSASLPLVLYDNYNAKY